MSQRTSLDHPMLNPMWIVRGLPLVATLLVAGAFLTGTFSVKHDFSHGLFVGGALGILIVHTIFSFQIKRVVLKETEQPSDVKRYPLT